MPADAQRITYRGLPLQQEPLFYASQLDANIAVALRPGADGGTLSGDQEQQVRRLAELELHLALHEATAPPELWTERDRILALISSGS